MVQASTSRIPPQFADYERFRDWLIQSFPDQANMTVRGNTFRDFVISLLPQTQRARRFGRLVPSAKQSHDRGVDVVVADPDRDRLAVQTKLSIRQKSELDEILSKFQDYQATRGAPQIEIIQRDDEPPVTFAIATSSRLAGIVENYEATQMASRPFYEKLKSEQRLLVWDGDDLLRDARQVLSRRYEVPLTVELTAQADWACGSPLRLGVTQAVQSRDCPAISRVLGDSSDVEVCTQHERLLPCPFRRPSMAGGRRPLAATPLHHKHGETSAP